MKYINIILLSISLLFAGCSATNTCKYQDRVDKIDSLIVRYEKLNLEARERGDRDLILSTANFIEGLKDNRHRLISLCSGEITKREAARVKDPWRKK